MKNKKLVILEKKDG